MEKNNWNLEKVKNFLRKFVDNESDYYMVVVNKETNQKGYATITKDKKIVIFEGKNDESKDKIYNQKEFKEKYRIEDLTIKSSKVTIEDIEMDLCDLDTEYREALAKSLLELNYINDTPLNLQYGTEKQQEELLKVWKKPLEAKQINEIINSIKKEMKGDFQYGRFLSIASYYISTAKEMRKWNESKKNMRRRERNNFNER